MECLNACRVRPCSLLLFLLVWSTRLLLTLQQEHSSTYFLLMPFSTTEVIPPPSPSLSNSPLLRTPSITAPSTSSSSSSPSLTAAPITTTPLPISSSQSPAASFTSASVPPSSSSSEVTATTTPTSTGTLSPLATAASSLSTPSLSLSSSIASPHETATPTTTSPSSTSAPQSSSALESAAVLPSGTGTTSISLHSLSTSSIQSSATPAPPSGEEGDSIWVKIRNFFQRERNEPLFIAGFTLGPVIVLLSIVVSTLICCFCCIQWRKRRKKAYDLNMPNGTPSYRPRSRASLQACELKHIEGEENNFYDDHPPRPGQSQPHHTHMSVDSLFGESLPSISPLTYPPQLRNYINHSDRMEGSTSPHGLITLSGSPSTGMRRFPGSSPSLHRPTPLGQQLKRQAEKSSTQGSRNSIQGSRASINALGSKTSFSGSRNSFFSNNTVSREEMRTSSSMIGGQRGGSEGVGSSLSMREDMAPLVRQTSLDVVPTRESPVQQLPTAPAEKRNFVSLTCIPNPLALQGDEGGREEGDGEDENDLRKDPILPLMTSTPAGSMAQEIPTKGERKAGVPSTAADTPLFSSPQRRAHVNLRQLTSLSSFDPGREGEGEGNPNSPETTASGGAAAAGRRENSEEANQSSVAQKEGKSQTPAEKPRARAMSRLEKLTSLDYIRSSIRRSLKKKRVSFLTKTPESTPKAKKKNPPPREVDLEPDPLTFSNQSAFDTDESANARIHTPSPLSPDFEGVDDTPQRYPNDFYNPDVYPETHQFHRNYPGAGQRMRAYSDMPPYPPQLSQPTYYPSMPPHYLQPSYPQLSQQYIPQPYVPPQPAFVGSPVHRAFAPMPPMAANSAPHPRDRYTRRYSDTTAPSTAAPSRAVPSQGVRGMAPYTLPAQNPEWYLYPSEDPRLRSPEALTEVSDGYGCGQSPDRFTETSNISDVRALSPDAYALMSGRNGYMEGPQRFRDSATNPGDFPTPGQYPPTSAVFPMEGGHFRERSIDDSLRSHDLESSFQSRMEPGLNRARMDPGPHRNGIEMGAYGGRMEMGGQRMESGWHSQREDPYEMGIPAWLMEGMENVPRSPERLTSFSDESSSEKPADSITPKARVSWNNEIIEYARTPSECSSDHYDL